jgi:hypothetical protein
MRNWLLALLGGVAVVAMLRISGPALIARARQKCLKMFEGMSSHCRPEGIMGPCQPTGASAAGSPDPDQSLRCG